MRLIVNVNFPETGSGPGPSISLTVDGADIPSCMDAVKEKLLKWAEEQSRSLYAGLPAPSVAPLVE